MYLLNCFFVSLGIFRASLKPIELIAPNWANRLREPRAGVSTLGCSRTHNTHCRFYREQYWAPHVIILAMGTSMHAQWICNTPVETYRYGECPASCIHDLPNSMRAPSSSYKQCLFALEIAYTCNDGLVSYELITIWSIQWVCDCCITPTQPFFSYIMAKRSLL